MHCDPVTTLRCHASEPARTAHVSTTMQHALHRVDTAYAAAGVYISSIESKIKHRERAHPTSKLDFATLLDSTEHAASFKYNKVAYKRTYLALARAAPPLPHLRAVGQRGSAILYYTIIYIHILSTACHATCQEKRE